MSSRKAKTITHVHDLRQLESEDTVQTRIVDGLEALGYEVLVTSRRRFLATCISCGQKFRPKGGDGASKGVPDLLVTHKAWPFWVWAGLEVKGPDTEVSPEQQDLAARFRIVIVRSLEQAVTAVAAVTVQLRKIREFDAIDERIQAHGGGR